jgi:hypothetical protein
MSFLRLSRGHTVAAIAALALLLVMAVDWYTTDLGREARRIAELQAQDPAPEGNIAAEADREVIEESAITAEEEERNAWQAAGFLNRLILVLMLAAAALALLAAALRAAGRRYPPPLSPIALAALPASLAGVLILIRIIEVGAVTPGGVVDIGAPLGLTATAAIALGAVVAARAEARESEPAASHGEPVAQG